MSGELRGWGCGGYEARLGLGVSAIFVSFILDSLFLNVSQALCHRGPCGFTHSLPEPGYSEYQFLLALPPSLL